MTRHLEAMAAAAFTDELRQSLPEVLAALDAAERDRFDRPARDEAYRLIHALKGAASMVGLAALGYLLNAAEDLIDPSVAGGAPLTSEALAILRASVPQFASYMDAALAGRPIEPIAIDLVRTLRQNDDTAELSTLRALLDIDIRELASLQPECVETPDQSPQASPMPADEQREEPPVAVEPELDLVPTEEISPELAEVFGQEAQEHLETIARLTSRLSTTAEDRDSVQELRRAVHTLKGAAGVVGYKGASKLAHRMEDLLDQLYEGGAAMTPQAVRVLASSSDALHDLILGAQDAGTLRGTVKGLFAELEALVGAAPPRRSAEMVAAGAAPEEEASAQPVAGLGPVIVEASDGTSIIERRRVSDRRHQSVADRRRGGEVLRVPTRRLNDLVRVVSEMVINRSTFEQHYAALIDQFDELKLSTARLRRVAHRLESEYEVRALAGNMATLASGSERAAGSRGGHGFDELEFDRYTEFHLLTRELAETASDIATVGARVGTTIGDFDGDLTRLGRLTREVQDKTMEFRMVPLGTMTARLERAVRVTAETCGKLVDFAIEGADAALDGSLLEQMADPLLHLLRNAVDHGVEAPARRQAAGKPERGQITVRAFHEGTDVVIEVQDDGTGLDLERIRRTAIEKSYVSEAAASTMAPDAVYAFIFEPGFSTAQQVTEVSGRGVGMDVVKSKVARMSGRVHITSQPGAGTTISMRVPMTLAIARILLVRAGGETFGLPLGAVVQIVRPHPTAIGLVGGQRVLTVDGRTYPLCDLADTLGLPRAGDARASQPVLIANLAGRAMALAVDGILNSRDAVVKTLGTHLRRVRAVWGATLFGDGTVILILNPADLCSTAEDLLIVEKPAARATADRAPYTVLIVDDSLSMRHVLSTAMRKAGWTPVPARDGLEALEIIHRSTQPPDLVLLDVEMPRMDGFEFLSTLRAQKAYADLPIVMLTSRGGDKHRDKAKALGATDYMVKPFQEEALTHNIDRLVKASRELERSVAS